MTDSVRNDICEAERYRLKEEIEMLSSVIDNSHDAIYVTDSSGMTRMVNSAHERITGIARENLVGHYIQDLVGSGTFSTYLTDNVVARREPVSLMQSLADGKQIMLTGTPVFGGDGQVKYVVTNVRDVTEIIDLEKKLAASEQIARMYEQSLFQDVEKGSIICNSAAFKKTIALAAKVAAKDSTVLILGETGSGKEVVTKYIHANSRRRNNNFIKINCGAIPDNLLESELFGYVKGAFTGASQGGKIGMFELAHNGTLFLDELGELPMHLQASLLRALQDGEFVRVGDTKVRKVNVRVLAATNRDLPRMIREGSFRSDLFYRLNVVTISVPPLAKRVEDIPELAELTIKKLNEKYQERKVLTSRFIDSLCRQDWPGNVRELENFIEKHYIIAESNIIDDFYLRPPDEELEERIVVRGVMPLEEATQLVESILIKRVMGPGVTTYQAADLLGTSQPTLHRHYKRILEREQEQEASQNNK